MKMTLNVIVPGLVALFAMAGATAQETDHSQMDHSQMSQSRTDHSQMDHSQMTRQETDHSQMDHSQMTQQETDHSQMDHSQMSEPPMDHSAHQAAPSYEGGSAGALAPLGAIPESGRAREAGFDDRYGMEPTSADADPATRCALGSRGLIMLDNAEWALCGGKPQGASRGPGYYPPMPPWNEAGTGQSHQMDHSAMGH